jgi:soluble lytic murein transglycosylase-like protein
LFRRLLLFVALTASTASADRVVTVDGGVLHVESYVTEGEWARLRLSGRGEILLRLAKIDRVVSDEPPAAGETTQILAQPFDLRFRTTETVPDAPYGELIFATARRHDLSVALVTAMVRAESAFDPSAVSAKGARGLLQLMPGTAERFGVAADSLFQPAENLEAGLRYLKFLTRRYPDDLARVLAAYNAGEVQVDRYGGVPPFRETRQYIRRISRDLAASRPSG